MHVVATAGHVDHGKSTLVSALTGQDPDRLEEEHRRGLSIELGYCWTTLDGVGDVAFVDVPGHERFLSTTLAGLGPVPVAMLVVAADDPWMPQAAEHLAALDALGVRRGLVAVTRADLADPGPALARAREEVGRTSLAGAPAVVVSGRTGAGLDDLRETLAAVLVGAPDPPSAADVRLWVDRVFHVKGAGVVVTGTLPAGTLHTGDELAAGPHRLRVRGLQTLGRPVDVVTGVARVALQLAGRGASTVERGSVLVTPEAFEEVGELDVRLRGDGRLPEQPQLYVGAGRTAVRARPLGNDFARLRLATPLPLRHGDRGILRDPGNRALWGMEVVDAAPPPLSRRGAARARVHELTTRRGDLAGEVAARGVVRRELLRRLGVADEPVPPGVHVWQDWLVSDQQWQEWRAHLVEAVQEAPDGMTPPEAARLLDLPRPGLATALVEGALIERHGRLEIGRAEEPGVRGALEALRDGLLRDPYAAPDAQRLAALGLDRATLARLDRAGDVLLLPEGIVLLPDADDRAAKVLASLPQPFTTSEARQALGTSRRVVLPLLQHLDRTGRTVRLPDDRRRVR